MRTWKKRTLGWVGAGALAALFVATLVWGPWVLEGAHIRDPQLAPSAGIIITGFRTMLVASAAGVVAALGLYYTHRNHAITQEQHRLAQKHFEHTQEQHHLAQKHFEHTQEQHRLAQQQFEHTQVQFSHTQQKDREQADLARETQLTERYIEASKLLASSKQTERLCGIYAFERIMRDSEKDYETVLEVFAAFIRQHARQEGVDRDESSRPQEDINAALTAICRRPNRDTEIAIDLSHVDLRGARFLGPLKDNAAPVADLRGFNLEHAWLQGAKFPGALLRRANLQYANLAGAHLVHCDLSSARLRGASLVGANLMMANLDGAWLRNCRMENTTLGGIGNWGSGAANLKNADLWEVTGLQVENLTSARIYESTVLPLELAKDGLVVSRIDYCESMDLAPQETPDSIRGMI
ncbi:pentapeptide repeat-containing protein [Streptomyces rimosus]|uniref:pentapeptide repeat-containing protein n=1 Tax=Streptomyces rimosus TaxID=1927 RepID=UPI00131EB457|nr:pentapeptide repeat-containing protein [Streptomyces rimosus]